MPDSSPLPASQTTHPATVVPHPLKWHQRLAAAVIFGLVRSVSATLRYSWTDRARILEQHSDQPVIFCAWHNRLALSLEVYRYWIKAIGPRRMAAMVSASKDGGILARVLERYGAQPVRGSTSRRGRQALLELITWAERGYDLAITPDGPRGPCYSVQDGVLSLAQVTGLPIIPASYSLGWKIRLKSWDRFQIPFPFSRCVVDFGAPIQVPRDLTDEQREELRRALEQRLHEISVD